MILLFKKWIIFIFFAVFCFNIYSCNGLRILGLFPFHSKSHFMMGESLMRGLARRGHHVDVYSHFPLKEPMANYRDYSLAGSLHQMVNNVTYDELVNKFLKAPSLIESWLEAGGPPICKLMELPVFQKLIHDPPKDPPYDLIISEICLANCYLAWNRHLNIPQIDLVTSFLYDWVNESRGNPMNLAVYPSFFAPYVAQMSFFERLNNFYISTYTTLLFKRHVLDQDAYVEKYFGPGYPDVIEMQKDLAMIFVNYHQKFNGIRPYVPSIVPVAGLHICDRNETLSQDLQKWMDESKDGFIYFTFGSMFRIETLPKHMLKAFYEAFNSIEPVRVLIKISDPVVLPENIPKNVKTLIWLPQTQILKHKNIRAFLTHGGLMGTQESIYYGVPMIGIPLMGDQHLNIKLSVKRGIAVKIDLNEITTEKLKSAFHKILHKPVFKRTVDKLSEDFRDLPINPLDTAIFWVEYIARHGKNSLRSPLVDMPWWQTTLLDVYGFIILILILIIVLLLYIIKKILQKCGQMVMSGRCRMSIAKLKQN